MSSSTIGAIRNFEYTPLEHDRDIRLVHLGTKPVGTTISSITFEFSHHLIDEAPAYYTLSYTWGSNGIDEEVTCPDGSVLRITANLAAWIRARGLALADESHLLWIDQLCINQSNIGERNFQVRMMQEIFKRSTKLFVWIGEESKDSTLALETVNQAGEVFNKLYNYPPERQLSFEEYNAKGFPRPNIAAWGAVFRLFQRPWFHRVWVQQEIAMSKGAQVVLQCGKMSIQWVRLEYTAYGLSKGQADMNAEVYELTLSAALQGSQMHLIPRSLLAVASTSNYRVENPKSLKAKLYMVLKDFQGCQATDARDMIFALVGMSHDSRDPVLVPDYHRPVIELYTEETFFMIKKYGLDILGEAGYTRKNLKGLPSWTVDWSYRSDGVTLLAHPRPQHYRAAGSSRLTLPSRENGEKFGFRGVITDTIQACGHPLQVDKAYKVLNTAILVGLYGWYQRAAQIAQLLSPYPTGQPWLEPFWRTLAADRTHLGTPAPPSYGEELPKVREYLELCDTYGYDAAKMEAVPKVRDLHSFYSDSWFLAAWYRSSFQRSFCSTKKGYMGLVPGEALEGDVVTVLLGGDLPFILRPVDEEQYVLIGDCYVDGIMNGEALQRIDAEVKEIIIQ
ncbi:hypothetical protein MMC28_000223 [Mycoblastus sanguinarius]|nr:hypothetical protein [Mycoblastus sanguinarius]